MNRGPILLIGVGFLMAFQAWLMPLGISPWLSHDAQFLAGWMLVCVGVGLVEVRALVEERR